MGTDLYLTASRYITVNKTGSVELQSYDINVISFTSEECERIAYNSKDPYKAYCDKCIEMYSVKDIPIYIWDVEDTPDSNKREGEAFLKKPKPEDIVGYKSSAKDNIEYLDMHIKEALEKGYELEWSAW